MAKIKKSWQDQNVSLQSGKMKQASMQAENKPKQLYRADFPELKKAVRRPLFDL
jgi:hypothetical protein